MAEFKFLPTDSNANQYWNGIDFLLPGSSALNSLFDPTGANAASAQAESNAALQLQAQAFNSAEAEKARAFEKEMSDTAYSRAFKDIERAGYNPWMLLQNGGMNSASTASGQAASSGINSVSMANNKMAMFAGIVATAAKMFLTKGK